MPEQDKQEKQTTYFKELIAQEFHFTAKTAVKVVTGIEQENSCSSRRVPTIYFPDCYCMTVNVQLKFSGNSFQRQVHMTDKTQQTYNGREGELVKESTICLDAEFELQTCSKIAAYCKNSKV